MFNEWILDYFMLRKNMLKEIRNPYPRRFDEYKQVFDNEIEQLSNEYTLRIEKKGMSWMMFRRNASNTIVKIIDSWHDEGFEEEELWQSRDEETDYEPPFVDVKTFEVKKARFKARIRKELKDKGIAYDEMYNGPESNLKTR
nr:hypothetical protein [Tanacetum cinerariifolium]